jgi:GNAT superfamily N-acetyltransferase
MISPEQWLKYLLYLDLSASHSADLTTEHAHAMRSGSAIAFCNRVMAKPTISDDEITKIINYYGQTPFRWFVEAEDTIQTEKIKHHGFKQVNAHAAMLANLTTMQATAYQADIRIEEVQTVQDLDSWIAIAAQSFTVDAGEFKKLIDYIFKYATPGTVHAYRALYNNMPVATSMVIKRGEIVSVHFVGTLDEYRGKGIGHAVTHKPLIDMHLQGAQWAILLASEMGKSIYEKMGFRQYATYNVYER